MEGHLLVIQTLYLVYKYTCTSSWLGLIYPQEVLSRWMLAVVHQCPCVVCTLACSLVAPARWQTEIQTYSWVSEYASRAKAPYAN